jgi:HK97 family phage major capsid protein
VLGRSAATGQAIIPNNFVADVSERASAGNVYRRIMNVVNGVGGSAVDIPYDADEIEAAIVQGAFGSNKDVRDFSFGEVTATLYTIAQIADVGNQLLRRSNGAAEAIARRRLGKSFAKAEARYITNGTGTNQPRGIFQAFLDYGGTAYNTAFNSEARVAAIGRGLGALQARGETATAIVMHPTDYWELATETLGTSGAGGWAFDAATGPNAAPVLSA